MTKRIDSLLQILEKRYTLLFLALVTFFVFLTLDYFNKINLSPAYVYFLKTKESTFVNISAIFIGIYFSLLGIFSTVRTQSVLINLKKEKLDLIFHYIFSGFISSFMYILFSVFIVNYDSSENYMLLDHITFFLIFFMFLSALRFGLYSFVIVRNDIKRIHNDLNEEKKKENELEGTLIKLQEFLEEYEDFRRSDRNKDIRDFFSKK